MYRQALMCKMRIKTEKGNLSVEDLFDLSLTALDKIAVQLNDELEKSPRKSFISDVNPDNSLLNLKFNIVKDVINVKLEQKQAREIAKSNLAQRHQLDELITQKENEALAGKSLEELKAMRKQLD